MDYETLKKWEEDPAFKEIEAGMKAFDQRMQQLREEHDRAMEAKKNSADPAERLEWVLWDKRRTCKHESAPLVKSHYSDEMVRRGQCPECGTHLLELD
jgi:hypothetical protein